MHFSIPLITLVALGIAGCTPTIPRNENSPWFAPPVGSKLMLNKAVTIQPNSARTYFQNGEIVPRTIDYYEPHCQLEVDDVLPVKQTIQPDTFVITDVSRDNFDVVQAGHTQLAGVGISIGLGIGDDGVSDIMYAWRMKLSSDKQLNVRTLICGGVFDTPADAEYPSINEMRKVLGSYAEIIIPASPDLSARQETPAEK